MQNLTAIVFSHIEQKDAIWHILWRLSWAWLSQISNLQGTEIGLKYEGPNLHKPNI
jgi:hypothetical protein